MKNRTNYMPLLGSGEIYEQLVIYAMLNNFYSIYIFDMDQTFIMSSLLLSQVLHIRQ